jgi:hypothetical protein
VALPLKIDLGLYEEVIDILVELVLLFVAIDISMLPLDVLLDHSVAQG